MPGSSAAPVIWSPVSFGTTGALVLLFLANPRAPNTETKKVRSWGVFRLLGIPS